MIKWKAVIGSKNLPLLFFMFLKKEIWNIREIIMTSLKNQFIIELKLGLFESKEDFIKSANIQEKFKLGLDGEDFTGVQVPESFFNTEACQSYMNPNIKPIKSGRYEDLGVFYDSYADKSAKVFVDGLDGFTVYIYKNLNVG